MLHPIAPARIATLAIALLAMSLIVGLSRIDSSGGMAVRNSLMLAAGAATIALPLAALLAILIVRTDAPGRALAVVLLLLMLLVPLYLQAAAWDAGFGKLGWYSALSGSLADPLLIKWRAAIWIHAMAAVPWATLIIGIGLRFVEPELEEEALLDGSAASVFLRVTLPRAIASLCVAGLWIMVTAFGEMTVTNIYFITNFAELLYTGFAVGDQTAQATIRVLPGAALTASLVSASLIVVSRLSPPADRSALSRPLVFRLGHWRWPAGVLLLAAIAFVVGVPFVNLFFEAGIEVRLSGDERVRVWSPAKFFAIVGDAPRRFREEFMWTPLIGALAATASLVVAAPLAWWARKGGRRSWPAVFIAAVLLALPGPVVGLAVNWPRNHFPAVIAGFDLIWLYDNTVFAPTVALMLRCLPLAIFICWYALRSISPDVLDAAKADGAGSTTRMLRVALPQRALALAAAWLASLALATGDLATSISTVPPPVSTLPILIFGMIHYGVTDQVAGACLVAAVGYVAIAVVLAGMARFAGGR